MPSVDQQSALALYFYALTAHFGQWIQTADQRRRHWAVDSRLLYAQVVKNCRRRRLAVVEHRVPLGTPDAFRQTLRALPLKRLASLTIAGRCWRSSPARPHASLRQSLDPLPARLTRQRFRSYTPAQAAGLTQHRWTVLEILASPAPPRLCWSGSRRRELGNGRCNQL
jgi:hypothetical protein